MPEACARCRHGADHHFQGAGCRFQVDRGEVCSCSEFATAEELEARRTSALRAGANLNGDVDDFFRHAKEQLLEPRASGDRTAEAYNNGVDMTIDYVRENLNDLVDALLR
jgi:hypothetical protein